MSTYEQELTIDTEALDVEWLEQPKLFMKYSRKKARALLDAKKAQERLKTVRSELVMDAHSGAMGKDVKVTKDSVDAWVRSQSEYVEAKEEQIQMEFEADIYDAAVFAFHQRKAALENLVTLHGQQYFAGPHVPRNLSEEYAKSRNAARERTAAVSDNYDRKGKRGRRRRPTK